MFVGFCKNLLLIICIFLLSVSCRNFLSPSSKTSDDSLLVDAQIAMNKKDYTSALGKFKLMSAAYLLQRDVIALNASAYAGRCGLDFIGLVNKVQTTTA